MTGLFTEHKWRHRRLIVFGDEARVSEQTSLLENYGAACDERDLLIIRSPGEETREEFGIEGGSFAAILLGKDGTEKARFERPIAPEELFGIIDEMPMRQREKHEREERGVNS